MTDNEQMTCNIEYCFRDNNSNTEYRTQATSHSFCADTQMESVCMWMEWN